MTRLCNCTLLRHKRVPTDVSWDDQSFQRFFVFDSQMSVSIQIAPKPSTRNRSGQRGNLSAGHLAASMERNRIPRLRRSFPGVESTFLGGSSLQRSRYLLNPCSPIVRRSPSSAQRSMAVTNSSELIGKKPPLLSSTHFLQAAEAVDNHWRPLP